MKLWPKGEPGAALGDWPALGPPDYLVVASPFLVAIEALLCVCFVYGAGIGLLLGAATIRPVYAAVILVVSVMSIAGPLLWLILVAMRRLLLAERSYIYVAADTVEVGTVLALGPHGIQKVRFARSELAQANRPMNLLWSFGDKEIWFDDPIPMTFDGSATVTPFHVVAFPWNHLWFGVWRHLRVLGMSRRGRRR